MLQSPARLGQNVCCVGRKPIVSRSSLAHANPALSNALIKTRLEAYPNPLETVLAP